jgi:glycine/D-amino acid oxidase-like deaminating enzyme
MPEVQPPLSSDETCELLIVGGGFTGLWAAMQAKERKLDADIIIIEQTFVADGASGRNGGFLNTSIAHGETNIEAQFPGEADELEALGEQNIKELLETLEKYNIDARYENASMTTVALDEGSAVRLYEEYQEAIAEEDEAGNEEAIWFDKEAIRKEVNSPICHAGLMYRGGLDGVVDPARLCFGLKDVLLNQLVKTVW